MNEDAEKEKLRLVEAAAKIMKNNIRFLMILDENEFYHDIASISLDDAAALLPESIKVFLPGIITRKDTSTKLASPVQALMQAARPRVLIFPQQLGLGIQMHYNFVLRFLNFTLYHMRFA